MQEILSPVTDKEKDEEKEDKPEIDAAGVSDAYNTLLEFIGVADFDSCNMIIKSLDGYTLLDENERERFALIRKAADRFDWDTVEKLIREHT